jgi:OOP family OmpA-OmpF porin
MGVGSRRGAAPAVVVFAALATLLVAPWHSGVGAQTEEDEQVPEPPELEIEVEVVSLTRFEHVTELVLEVTRATDEPVHALGLADPAYQFANRVGNARYNDLSGVRLRAEGEDITYLPFRNMVERFCTCGRVTDYLPTGDPWTMWWRSEPLPDDVDTVTVLGPGGVELATGVPVEDADPGSSASVGGESDLIDDLTREDLEPGRTLDLAAGSTILQDDEPVIDVSEDVVSLRADVLFEFGEATLTPRAESVIDEAVNQIEGLEPVRLGITGHTDSIGDDDANQGLSEQRAQAVEAALGDRLGADMPPAEVAGRGETEPVAPNENPGGSDNPHGRALNRRVQIDVIE